jgi:spoIIIJ-associated protein
MDQQQSVAYAKKYLEDIISFFGVNISVDARITEEVIELNIPSSELNPFLIGVKGETLRSLQYLVSTTLKNRQAELHRINIDVANYKAQRADRLVQKITSTLEKVKETGETTHLPPMNPADRRVVHQAVAQYPELETYSEGEGRDRHIVITKKEM